MNAKRPILIPVLDRTKGMLVVALVVLASGGPVRAAEHVVGSCTPELVYNVFPGTVDASGSGIGNVAAFRHTDAAGIPQPLTTATVAWTARAIVDAPNAEGAAPQIGGDLELVITTGSGEQLSFTATCIAGSGALPSGLVVYADGLVRGWLGSPAARRAFVHFEAWTDHRKQYAYVALIDGSDCELNFAVSAVTQSPYALGTGAFTALPPHVVYSETDCARRFGDPFPRSVAPGLRL